MFMKRRFHKHYWTACLLLLVSLLSRIQGLSDRSTSNKRYNLQSNVIPRQTTTKRADTLAAIDAALLQTRGGWMFRSRKRGEGTNETEAGVGVDPREQAAQLRAQGKANHDLGDFEGAATQFQQAANLLGTLLLQQQQQSIDNVNSEDNGSGDGDNDVAIVNVTTTTDNGTDSSSMIVITDDIEISDLQDEWATCRLHESLCQLKAKDYDACILACDALVEEEISCAPVFRARAYHRRAKAKVALNDTEGALMDAKAAAFLGDRKAVTFYGKLLRESGGGGSGMMENPLEALFSSPGSAPGMPDSSLLGSLLSKSSLMDQNGNDNGNPTDFLTSSLLGSMGAGSPGGMGGAGGGGSLAKSVLKKLSKTLDDESTHDGICQYLQSTNAIQLQTYASMAGLELSLDQASRLVNVAHGVTPRTIRRTVKYSKRALWGIQLIRKIMALLSKYRHILFLLVLLQWTKSAVVRPMPVPKVKAPRKARGGGRARPALKTAPQPPPVPPPNANADNGGAAAAMGGGKKRLTPGLLNPLQGGGLR